MHGALGGTIGSTFGDASENMTARPSAIDKGPPPVHIKSDAEMKLMLNALEKPNAQVLVRHLDESKKRDLCTAMSPMSIDAHEMVIDQGGRKSDFYIIAEGHFNVYVSRRGADEDIRGLVGRLGPGESFGELALAYGCARQATVASTSAGKLFVLAPEVYVKHFYPTHPPERFNSHGKFLAGIKLFDILTLSEKQELGLALGEELHGSGEVIFSPGEHTKFIYILMEGSVVIQSEEGETHVVSEPGKVFGELTLADKRMTCTAVASDSGCSLLVLPADRSAILEPIKHDMMQLTPSPVYAFIW
jgi:CRP-like cAMP-binding protein